MKELDSLRPALERLRSNRATPEDLEQLRAYAHAQLGDQPVSGAAPLSGGEVMPLVDAVAALSSYFEVERALQGTAEQLTRLLNVPACAISKWNRARNTLTLWVQHGPPQWDFDPRWHGEIDLLAYPLTQHVLERREIVQLRLDKPDQEDSAVQFMQQKGVKTLFMMPLVAQDRTIGLVELMDDQNLRTLTTQEITIGKLVANHAAIVIERAFLLEEAEQRAAELEALRQATLGLTASLDLPEVLDAILKNTMDLIPGSHNADIFLYQQGKLIFGAAIWQDGRRDKPFAPPRDNGLTYTVALTGETILVDDMRQHPLFEEAPASWGGSIVGLPLKIGKRVVGVMNIANTQPYAISEAKLYVLSLLADHAAIAIENARLHDLVRQQARTDIITGLNNRRALDRRLEEEVQRSERYQRAFSLLMLDLDNFKIINDTYGHPAGDRVLEQVARCLQGVVRESDFLARFGGDEFSVVLPETDVALALKIADRLREALASCPPNLPDAQVTTLSASIGLATFPKHAENATTMLVAADKALYQAKKESPGRIICAPGR